jgi:hypothetical protein
MLIKEVLEQFLSQQKAKLAPKTYRDYELVIGLFKSQLDGYAWNNLDDGDKVYDDAQKKGKVSLIFMTILTSKIMWENF